MHIFGVKHDNTAHSCVICLIALRNTIDPKNEIEDMAGIENIYTLRQTKLGINVIKCLNTENKEKLVF